MTRITLPVLALVVVSLGLVSCNAGLPMERASHRGDPCACGEAPDVFEQDDDKASAKELRVDEVQEHNLVDDATDFVKFTISQNGSENVNLKGTSQYNFTLEGVREEGLTFETRYPAPGEVVMTVRSDRRQEVTVKISTQDGKFGPGSGYTLTLVKPKV